MTTEETLTTHVPVAAPKLGHDDQGSTITDSTLLKRKASPDVEDDEGDTKRQRQDDDDGNDKPQSIGHVSPPDRKSLAAQEEKKRSKRLFGGLLSTLSQTNVNSQHKRRQEIERRQQERLQKQREEDDQKRAEKLSRIKEARMIDQIDFEAQAMRHRHTKLSSLARFLKTKTQPTIYYLPWKRTSSQEDIIEEQIRAAKDTIEKEEEEFKKKRERHLSRYGASTAPVRRGKLQEEAEPKEDNKAIDPEPQKATATEVREPTVQHDSHDESGDVLVEAEEDMVIY